MSDIDKPTLALETTLDTGAAEQGWASLLEKLSTQSEETTGFLKELTKVLEELVGTVVTKGAEAQQLVAKATDSTTKARLTITEELAKIREETKLQLGNLEELYSEYGIKVTGNMEQMARSLEGAINKAKADAGKGLLDKSEAAALVREMEEDLKSVYDRLEKQKKKGVGEAISGKLEDVAKVGSLGEATGSILGNITSAIPGGAMGGGLIGLLLYGIGSAEALRSQAESVGQVFRREIDATTASVVGNVTSLGDSMSAVETNMKLAKGSLAAVNLEFAKAGISAQEAGFTSKQMSDAMSESVDSLRNNLGALTLAADKAFGFAEGTTAKNAVALSRELGGTVKENADQFIRLSMAAKESGTNVERYETSVKSAAKSLAQFGIDLSGATVLMQQLNGNDTTGGLQSSRAMQGIGQAFQGIAGNVSMSALFASRMAEQNSGIGEYKVGRGEDVDPLAARRAMLLQMGQAGGGNNQMLGDVLKMMQSMAREAGGTKSQQEFFLEKQFNVDTITAAAINKLTPAQIAELQKTGKTEGLDDKDLKAIQTGMTSAKDRNNKFQDAMKDAIEGILGMVRGLLQGVGAIVQWLSASGTKERGEANQAMHEAGAQIKNGLQLFGRATKEVVQGVAGATGVQTPKAPPPRQTYTETLRDMGGGTGAPSYADIGKGLKAWAVAEAAPTSTAGASGARSTTTGGGDVTSAQGQASYNPGTRSIQTTVNLVIPADAITQSMSHDKMNRGGR